MTTYVYGYYTHNDDDAENRNELATVIMRVTTVIMRVTTVIMRLARATCGRIKTVFVTARESCDRIEVISAATRASCDGIKCSEQ